MKKGEGIIPSVDLIAGKVVRLKQGDYAKETLYAVDALETLKGYEKAGAHRLHIVDLEGAKDSQKRQTAYIAQLVKSLTVPVQTGGGIRLENDVRVLLDAGVDRVVVGSLSVHAPETVYRWLQIFGANRLTLALDCHVDEKGEAFVATHGWQKSTNQTVEALIDFSNTTLYRTLCEKYPDLVIEASGGIGSVNDLKALRKTGVAGVIIGRAFLENQLTVKEAIQCWQNESFRA